MPTDLPSTLVLIARLLIGYMFLEAAVLNIPIFDRLTAHVASRGVPMPRIAMIVATALQGVCAILVITGFWLTWATIGLIAFTVAATYLFHNFWDMEGDARFSKRLTFRGNIIIIGGLFALLAISL